MTLRDDHEQAASYGPTSPSPIIPCIVSKHEADRGEAQEGEALAVEVLPIFGEPSTAIEPGDGALDDPSFGQDANPST
jgi:hypothetical protein